MDPEAKAAFAALTDAVKDLRAFLSAVLQAEDPTNPNDESGQRGVYTIVRYGLHPTEELVRRVEAKVDALTPTSPTVKAAAAAKSSPKSST